MSKRFTISISSKDMDWLQEICNNAGVIFEKNEIWFDVDTHADCWHLYEKPCSFAYAKNEELECHFCDGINSRCTGELG